MATITLGGKRAGITTIDDECLDLLSGTGWSIGAQGYVRGRVDGKVRLMHRVIADRFLGAKPDRVVDHINGDKLDNTLQNLRVCFQCENARNVPMKKNNTSGMTGVCWDRTRKKWLAHITLNRKFINLGWYQNFEYACSARRNAESKYFGQYAYGARKTRAPR